MVKSDLTKKADFTFYQLVGLGLAFLILFLLFILKIYPLVFWLLKSSWHQLAAVCSCLDHLTLSNHPFIFTSLILIGAGLLALALFMVIRVVKLKLLTNKFIKTNLANKNQGLAPILNHLAQELGLQNQIIEINDKQPIIFCFGLIKSKICISSGSIKKLSQPELKAVLRHEQHHLLSHEPLKIFILQALAKILFFLPGLKYFFNQYLVFSELAADEWATDNWQNKGSLASALYKALKWKKQLFKKNELALSFFADRVIEERVNKLADSGYRVQFRFFNSKLGLGLLLLILTFIFLNTLFSFSGTALANHDNNQCLLSEQDIISQCDLSLEKAVCQSANYGFHNSACSN